MEEDKKVGVGIVGCGAIADIHALAIQNIDSAELISVYSRNINNANRLGQKYMTKAFDSWESFISDDRLDVVSLCTPSGTHLNYGELIAKAGKHVVVEKPIEVTLQRGQKLIQVCEENGVELAVIFQNRFLPEVITMKKIVADSGIGKLFLADATVKWFRDQAYYDSAQWRGTFALDGGGVLINQAIHTIDLLQWLVGKVDTVFGQIGTCTHQHIEGEDTAVATLHFESGALGIIEASTSIVPARDRNIEIHGDKGTLALDGNSLKILDNKSSQQDLKITDAKDGSGSASPMQNVSSDLHERQFEAILSALRTGDQPPVSGEESLKSLAIIEGIYLSAKEGHPVKISNLIDLT